VSDPSVAVIVLAAGSSTRLGRPKQLLLLSGRPLLERTLDLTRAAPFAQRLLVLGAHANEIEAAVDTRGFTVIDNPDYASGQASSLRAGLRGLSPNIDAALVMLGDQPLVPAWLPAKLVESFNASKHVAARPRYAGRPGNPVLLSRALFTELEQLNGDVGARDVLKRHTKRVLDIELLDAPTPRDVDSEDDYAALLRDWSSTGAPDVPRYCQRCAAPLALEIAHQRLRPVCPVCRFTFFFDPKLAVAVVVSIGGHIVLQRRAITPGLGRWTFPGGFVDRGELPEAAAAREVWEEVGLSVERLYLLGVYSEPGETVTLIAYHASADGQIPIVGHESSAVGVFDVADLPDLAFSRDARVLAEWSARCAPPLMEHTHD
jgi:CTP:molybdopterin cytidylyltransferase MocA/ADP-ribose pyrophosphatase YjhB (NUDIX family)